MSFQEKRSLVNIFSAVSITAAYGVYMAQRFPEGGAYSPEVLHFWGAFFLTLVPVTIIARIVIYIVFHFLNTIATREQEADIKDERDHFILLRAQRLGFYVFVLGFLLAMASLVLEQPPTVMFVIFVCTGIAAEVASETSQFYFYRRGV